ncbi:MAG TPA: branched-chain amino acid ABC transporter permease [Azospirillaceae bacterium]|nr:branched-chain amino acid ABC transporter permease [Azospirillaceae bacterium]
MARAGPLALPAVGAAVVAALLALGLVLPSWLLFLGTMAAANGLVTLGITFLMRSGVVSFGQGLMFATGGYAAALAFNRLGITEAPALLLLGGVCGAVPGILIGPLLARYRGIFFAMLTLAMSMVLYGALVKSPALGGSDGFNMSRPTFFGTLLAEYGLFATAVVATGIAGVLAAIHFRSVRGLVSLAVQDNELRVEYLGMSVRGVVAVNFAVAATLGGIGGALSVMTLGHIDPNFSYWTTSGEFVFAAILAGHHSVVAVFVAAVLLELVRSFSSLYFPNTWQLALGLFLLLVIVFLPEGLGSLWARRARRRARAEPEAAPGAVPPGTAAGRVRDRKVST